MDWHVIHVIKIKYLILMVYVCVTIATIKYKIIAFNAEWMINFCIKNAKIKTV